MKRSGVVLAAFFLFIVTGIASAQQSDVSANLTGSFSNTVNGNGLSQTATNSAGILLTYSHFMHRNSGFDVNYGYTRNSQIYVDQFGAGDEFQAGVHELTGAYVLRFPRGKVQPFALAGGGLLIFNPTSNAINSTLVPIGRQVRPTFLYGVGADFRARGGLAVRAQYRALVYEATDLGVSPYLHTGSAMQTVEPSIGIVYKF